MVDAMAYSVRRTHLDGHLNMHLHPMVLPILRELAPRDDIRAMRLSREDLGSARSASGPASRGANRMASGMSNS